MVLRVAAGWNHLNGIKDRKQQPRSEPCITQQTTQLPQWFALAPDQSALNWPFVAHSGAIRGHWKPIHGLPRGLCGAVFEPNHETEVPAARSKSVLREACEPRFRGRKPPPKPSQWALNRGRNARIGHDTRRLRIQPGSRTYSSSIRRRRAAMMLERPRYPTGLPGWLRSTTGIRPTFARNIRAAAS